MFRDRASLSLRLRRLQAVHELSAQAWTDTQAKAGRNTHAYTPAATTTASAHARRGHIVLLAAGGYHGQSWRDRELRAPSRGEQRCHRPLRGQPTFGSGRADQWWVGHPVLRLLPRGLFVRQQGFVQLHLLGQVGYPRLSVGLCRRHRLLAAGEH